MRDEANGKDTNADYQPLLFTRTADHGLSKILSERGFVEHPALGPGFEGLGRSTGK
jgi:hypothetical protein